MSDPHATADAAHGHDEGAHGGAALGPVDLRAWGYGALGVILGLVVVLVLERAAGLIGS